MYLDFFGLKEYPFTLTPNTNFFCLLPQYREALNVLLLSIRSGEGFIKVVGDVGTGKTMLCHALLRNLEEEYITAYIANPSLDYIGLHLALAQELELDIPEGADQYRLLTMLNKKLLELYKQGKKLVVIIDEAQILSDQGMEGLRLLSNLETGTAKLLQLVLVGQTELDKRLKQENLRQLRQRIAFSYRLQALSREEARVYVEHRLLQAGNRDEYLFSKDAIALLTKASMGNPRVINILCHKAFMVSFGMGARRVTKAAMKTAIDDTDSISSLRGDWVQSILPKLGWGSLVTILVVELILLTRFYL